MIQINLIPDVKREYLRAQKMRNAVVVICIVSAIAAGAIVILMAIIVGGQTLLASNNDNSIKKEYAKVSDIEDVDKVVTVQNQLANIADLHANRSIQSRIFAILQQIQPGEKNAVSYSTVSILPEENVIRIEGYSEGGYPAIETFKKTIAQAKIDYVDNTEKSEDQQDEEEGGADKQAESKGDEQNTRAEMTLASNPNQIKILEQSLGEDSDGKQVSRFTMSFEYDDKLLKNTITDMRVVLPNVKKDVTDSRLRIPESLFGEVRDINEGGENGNQ